MACGEQRAPATGPTTGARGKNIYDGAHENGNPNFFFLPPMVPDPSRDPNFSAGQFNGTWKPVVQICRLGSNLGAGCQTPWLRTYSGSDVSVSQTSEQYSVNWDTREVWATPATYRVRVAVVSKDTIALGYADVALLADASAKNARTFDVIPMADGRTIPVKFRIEQGATVTNTTDFVEKSVSNTGGTVVTSGGSAGLTLPSGWLGTEASSVVVTIERLSVTPQPDGSATCVSAYQNLEQFEGCYHIATYPSISVVHADVVVGVCPALSKADARYESQVLFKFDAPEQLTQLPGAAVPFLDCSGYASLPRPAATDLAGRIEHGASSALAALGRVLTPRSAYAIDLGVGGLIGSGTDGFSDFFWGVPMSVQVTSGDQQTAIAGSALTSPVTVRVVGDHQGAPMAGQTVTFSTIGGSLANATAVTDANGFASTAWTLGTTVGAQGLDASIARIGRSTTVHVAATAAAPALNLSGSITDPRLDATSDTRISLSPDILGVDANVANGNLTLSVQIRSDSGDPAPPFMTISLDVDRNPATGYSGVDAAHNDAALLGVEYLVEIQDSTSLRAYHYSSATGFTDLGAPQNCQPTYGSGAMTYTCTIPLSVLPLITGPFNFKASVQALLATPGTYTGILDYASDIGKPVGTASTTPVIP